MTRPLCVVATWFYESQGFLDFKYRLRALGETHRLLVYTRRPLDPVDFDGVEFEQILLAEKADLPGLLRYQWRLWLRVRLLDYRAAVLLGSHFGFLAAALPRSVLYWNEHPLQIVPRDQSHGIKRHLYTLLLKLWYRASNHAAVILPISNTLRDDLFAHGVDSAHTRVEWMGVDESFFAHAKLREIGNCLRVVYVGTVHPARGRDVMLDAFARLKQLGIPAHLTIVGASPEQLTYCRARVAELDIADVVQIEGRVLGREVPGWLDDAHAGICLWENRPHWQFNPPTKLFEYLAAGLPVIASDIRTHTDYLREGYSGAVFPYGVDGLVEAVRRLWDGRAHFGEMSRAAMDEATQYSWNGVRSQFEASVAAAAGQSLPRLSREATDGPDTTAKHGNYF